MCKTNRLALFARTASALPSLLVVVGVVAALGGCGTSTSTLVCEPACPNGTHCTSDGCVPDDPNNVVDLAVTATDIAMTCVPQCAGATPYCNANRVCAPCLLDTHCPAGQVCKSAGNSSVCVPGCTDDARCNAGGAGPKRCCNGGCIDVTSDAQNCGACGNACSGQHSSAKCQAGACVPGACSAGWGDCNMDLKDGCETNLRIDAANCGGCGTACKFANAIPGCSDTCYIAACKFGFDDCNGDEKDGCETSVTSDPKNCGGCGMACPMVANAKNACVNAGCALTSCNQGFSDCDGNPKTGCEVTTGTDVNNCGACGNKCAQGLACINSSCTCQNCVLPGAKTKCVNLQCLFDSCLPGYADCNNNQKDGCEVDLTTDPKNCGGCGTVCPNNMPACINSACSNAGKCSDVATAWCKAKGWVIAPWQTAFPGQPGGTIYCVTPGNSAGADCDTCKTYNQLVWKNTAQDACNSKSMLVPGNIYGGHSPCACNPGNLLNCGQWDMMGCMPD